MGRILTFSGKVFEELKKCSQGVLHTVVYSLRSFYIPLPKFLWFCANSTTGPCCGLPMSLTIVACWGNLNAFRKIYNVLDNTQEEILNVIKYSLFGIGKVSGLNHYDLLDYYL